MNRDHLVAGYLVAVGLGMLGMWVALLGTGQVPELRTAPYEIGYHLVAEMLTAVALLAAGVGRLRGRAWGQRASPAALGMLLYTVLNSAGYYAQRGETPMVGLFAVLTVATVVLLVGHLRARTGGEPRTARIDEEAVDV